ncbi:MAG: pseudouridine synthase [Nannocystaceae bacterium]
MAEETCPIVHVVIDPEDAGERADVVLGRRIPGLSRRVARALALEGRLFLDDRRSPPSTRVAPGQRVELRVRPHARPEPSPRPTILAVDEAIVYVDKPPGIATHRLRPDEAPALVDLVALEFPECAAASPDPREGGAVHRLDAATSGVVAIARSPAAWRAARAAFDAGAVGKLYAAIVAPGIAAGPELDEAIAARAWARIEPATEPTTAPRIEARVEIDGDPATTDPEAIAARTRVPRDPGGAIAQDPAGAEAGLTADVRAALGRLGFTAPDGPWIDVQAPLGRGEGRARVAVTPAGEPARSRVLPLVVGADGDLVAVLLRTGRRHQARVHLAALGAPIVGDPLYGGREGVRLFLHAWRLDLRAAFARAAPVLSPLPASFAERLGRSPRSLKSAAITGIGGDP